MFQGQGTTLERWRALLLRLNEVEARALSDREQLRRYVAARTTRAIRPRLVLRPQGLSDEDGPPCGGCGEGLRPRDEVLIACTACLEVAHACCLSPGATCFTAACQGADEVRRRA